MEDTYQSEKNHSNKKFILGGLFIGVIVIFILTITFVLTSIKSSKTASTLTTAEDVSHGSTATVPPSTFNKTNTTPPPEPKTFVETQNSPQVDIKKWQEPSITPIAAPDYKLYSFKQNYSLNEVRNIAHLLQADGTVKQDNDKVLAYYLEPAVSTTTLSFNKKTGSFSYLNTRGIELSSKTDLAFEDRIYDFLKSINWYDPTMKVTTSYKRKDSPNITFYEIHRVWDKAGLPILNFNGLFNLPENELLSNLNINSKVSTIPANDLIYGSSDTKDGLTRQNDFNTMTLAITSTSKKLVGISSNLRQLDESVPQTIKPIDYQAAITKLKNNQYDLIFTSPSGKGTVDWTALYPNNKAVGDSGIITEALYTYLEKTPSEVQTTLQPYLIVKGTSALKSGYTVNFIASIPVADSKVLGATTTYLAQNQPTTSSQYQGILTIVPSPFQTQHPTATAPVACQPPIENLHPRFIFQGVQLGLGPKWRTVLKDNGERVFQQVAGDLRWYYIPPTSFNTLDTPSKLAILQSDWNKVLNNIDTIDAQAKQVPGSNGVGMTVFLPEKDVTGNRGWGLVLNDFMSNEQYFGGTCPIIFSGMSPSLFVYGKYKQTLDIQSGATLTYMNPAAEKNVWHVTINKNNVLNVNGSEKKYIYYEYAAQQFSKPNEGWIINKNQLSMLTKTVATLLHLNPAESDRLAFELKHAAGQVKGDHIFVGQINKNEITKKVPLSFSVKPDVVERIHFYVGKAAPNDTAKSPKISSIARKEFMVLELGSYSEKTSAP